MRSELIIVSNKLGLHARASAKLVKLAGRFASQIELEKGEKRINAKSIMGVMMLAASQGTQLTLIAIGEDEIEAVEAIMELFANKFGEEE